MNLMNGSTKHQGRFRRTALLVVGLGITALAVDGCSLVVDTDALTNGDVECGNAEKVCIDGDGFSVCESKNNPAKGCGASHCGSCSLPHAKERCTREFECDISACDLGFENCDGSVATGCDVDISSDEDKLWLLWEQMYRCWWLNRL